jgi:uncharacterized protein (TIGR02246 family)
MTSGIRKVHRIPLAELKCESEARCGVSGSAGGRAQRVASLYAPDGDRINADFELARGRAEIANQYEKEFARRKADASTIPFHASLTIRLLGTDTAILDGEWEGFRTGKKVRGQFTVIAKKGPGGWQIAAGRVRGVKEL